jgi:hypothetical protein
MALRPERPGIVHLGAAEPAGLQVPAEFEPVAREWTRSIIAGGLVLLLAVCIVGSFWYTKWGLGQATERDDLLKLVFTPLIGLLSAITGFYFGERKGAD